MIPTILVTHSLTGVQDKAEDGDVDMKDDAKDGDVSPIDRLGEDSKPSSSKKREPGFEVKPNFSRVTPGQLQYVSFPSESRYQPVRTITATTSAKGKGAISAAAKASGLGTEKYGGGGGILILVDMRPDEEAEYLELQAPPVVPPPPQVVPPAPTGRTGGVSGPHIALDENGEDAAPPEPFEVSLSSPLKKPPLTLLPSTHLTMTPKLPLYLLFVL